MFPECLHGPLENKRKWLQPGTKAAVLLEEICLNRRLLSDIAKLSGAEQTWNLEAFHSLINQFAPKMFYFTPVGMECRVKLAALHYNENASRGQMYTKSGNPVFQISYPKYKKGQHIVRKVLKNQTFEYMDKIWFEAIVECEISRTNRKEAARKTVFPPTLCDKFEKPDKETAVRKHCSRFKKM